MMHSLFTSAFLLLLAVAVAIVTDAADSQWIIPTLPGFPGPLPFKLETGYIGVGENEEVQMFYYFVESQGDPVRDPLLLWHTGGPGCSVIMGFLYEVGPLSFDLKDFNGRFPSLVINPYAWTQVASIIFLDTPVGSGYSYSTTQEGYYSSDTQVAQQNYMFLRKWMLSHPEYMQNWLYIAGDSYGGKIATMVAYEVAKGNEEGLEPIMMLQGHLIGNGLVSRTEDFNERVPYAHRMALVSDEHFEFARDKCRGNYVNPDPNNVECLYALEPVKACMEHINLYHILEPSCELMSRKSHDFQPRKLLEEDDLIDDLPLLSKHAWPCRSFNDLAAYVWANNSTVQEALHVRQGTFPYWRRCNESMSYDEDVESVFEYHKFLNEKGFQILAYSGDHDMAVPYLSTLKWIRKLNLTLEEEWRPWFVGGQVAGYTEKYDNHKAYVTFATVKGAGHVTPEYKPKESFQMFKRWISLYPI